MAEKVWPEGGWEAVDREECYEFNKKHSQEKDTGECKYCKHYLTLSCKKLDEFMDDINGL